MDELGVPFGITIDFQTLEDDTVTLRERDSMEQVRMPLADVAPLMEDLVKETATWKVRCCWRRVDWVTQMMLPLIFSLVG